MAACQNGLPGLNGTGTCVDEDCVLGRVHLPLLRACHMGGSVVAIRQSPAPSASAASRSIGRSKITTVSASSNAGRNLSQASSNRIAGGLPEAAMARALHRVREPHEFVDLVVRAATVGDLVERCRACSDVPTRQGVQKPQLSCAKKCAKLRATSNMSRSLPNTIKAPAVGTSSNAIWRSEFVGRQTDARGAADLYGGDVAGAAVFKHLLDAYAEGVFVDARARAIAGNREDLAARGVPRPAPAKRAPPYSATSVASASVSTLSTTVGFPRYPTVTGKGGRMRGSPGLPSRDSISANSSPQTYAPAPRWISMSKSKPAAPRIAAPRGRSSAHRLKLRPRARSSRYLYSPRR